MLNLSHSFKNLKVRYAKKQAGKFEKVKKRYLTASKFEQISRGLDCYIDAATSPKSEKTISISHHKVSNHPVVRRLGWCLIRRYLLSLHLCWAIVLFRDCEQTWMRRMDLSCLNLVNQSTRFFHRRRSWSWAMPSVLWQFSSSKKAPAYCFLS